MMPSTAICPRPSPRLVAKNCWTLGKTLMSISTSTSIPVPAAAETAGAEGGGGNGQGGGGNGQGGGGANGGGNGGAQGGGNSGTGGGQGHGNQVPPQVQGLMRRDRNLVPLNTRFDLYSQGKDGESRPPLTAKASWDDVLRANDGSFVGLASNY